MFWMLQLESSLWRTTSHYRQPHRLTQHIYAATFWITSLNFLLQEFSDVNYFMFSCLLNLSWTIRRAGTRCSFFTLKMSSARRYLAGSWRALCSAFTLDPNAEKFAFARFQNEANGSEWTEAAEGSHKTTTTTATTWESPGNVDATELGELRKTSSASAGEGGINSGSPKADEDVDHNNRRTKRLPEARISAWQAGWNVTNAIQVRLVSLQYFKLKSTNSRYLYDCHENHFQQNKSLVADQ